MSRPQSKAGTGANPSVPVPVNHLAAVAGRVLAAFLRPLREEVPCCHKARPWCTCVFPQRARGGAL